MSNRLEPKHGPLCRQALPEGDAAVGASGQDPGVWHCLGFGAHTHVCVQAKAQQEAAQQGGVVLTVSLQRTHTELKLLKFKTHSLYDQHYLIHVFTVLL